MKTQSFWSDEGCCLACGRSGVALHHLKSRGSGGSNLEHNLMPVCWGHHTEVHTIGLQQFSIKYPQVEDWLFKNGWEYDPYLEKWTHELE